MNINPVRRAVVDRSLLADVRRSAARCGARNILMEVIVKTARLRASLVLFSGLLCFAYGCSNTGESASRDKLTSNVGKYDAAPAPAGEKPRVGVPPFKVQTNGGIESSNNLPQIAADQMTTLLDQTGRFEVTERAQVEQLLDEQNME